MQKTSFENISISTSHAIEQLTAAMRTESALEIKKHILEKSPYSAAITDCLLSYQELYSYCKLQLQEAQVTRRALIRDIDPDLWVSAENKTNRELMRVGKPPYAFDAPEGLIELHHIGQEANSPFAELTIKEHLWCGNSKILHPGTAKSWRTDSKAEAKFSKERSDYWKKREKGEISLLGRAPVSPIEPLNIRPQEEFASLLRETAEMLFRECSVTDLRYLSDLANSHILMKEFGSNSISDFLEQNAKEEVADSTIKCTFCGARKYSLNGYGMSGDEKIQRYKCNKCGHTFTAMNQSIIFGCSFTFAEWLKFINCLYNGLSEEATAQICHISKRSVHNNRLKVFYALKLLDDRTRLRGNIVIDETYFPVSFKGNRSLQSNFSMERKAHKRGSEIHRAGLSKDHVCVVCAIDEYGKSVARIAGRGAPSAGRIQEALGDAIDRENVTCIYSDKEPAIKAFAQKNGYPIKQAILLRKNATKTKSCFYTKEATETRRQLQRINAYHSRLNDFLDRFLGTSSRLLTGYLCLFAWKDRNRSTSSAEAYQALMSIMVEPNLYKSVDEINRMPCFCDVANVTHASKKEGFKDLNRASEIYAMYAAGVDARSIGERFGVSRAAIYWMIQKFKRLGLAYKTLRDVRAEEKEQKKKQIVYPYTTIARNQAIYAEKKGWEGPLSEFYNMIAQKYHLLVQSVKNIIATEERIEALREAFFIYENFDYKTLQEVYQSVYQEYSRLVQKHNKGKTTQLLAERFHFKIYNIRRIIKIMSEPENDSFWAQKKKISIGETVNRDKAVFVDFLKWTGSKKNFCIWAAEKYGLNYYYIYQILRLNFIADRARFENTYRRPTPHKE